MAQGQLAPMPPAIDMASKSSEELRVIREYSSIVRFRDTILSGSHPRIKVPAQLVAAKAVNSPSPSSPSVATGGAANSPITTTAASSIAHQNDSMPQINRGKAMGNYQAFHANSLQPSVSTNLPGLGTFLSNGPRAQSAAANNISKAKPEINPILFEKSDHLTKTEIQIQRQRVERALREQLEQRRSAVWALQPSEPVAEFDMMDVLQKALVLADQTAPPSTDANVATNKSDESDSFDENTFYSSHFDSSPNSNHLSRVPNESSESESAEMRESPDYEPVLSVPQAPEPERDVRPAVPHPVAHAPALQEQTPLHEYATAAKPPPELPQARHELSVDTQQQQQPRANIQRQDTGTGSADTQNRQFGQEVQVISSQGSRDASRSGDSGNKDNDQSTDDRCLQPLLAPPAFPASLAEGGSTVVRGHDLSPLAPQPSHVSPLAIPRHPPASDVGETQRPRGTPPQVAALRNQPSAGSSPESSPQTGKGLEKRKGKRRQKRKADRQVVDVLPYIKAEPRSPSPISTLPSARPHKRLRPSQRTMDELNYDEPRYAPASAPDGHRERPGAPGPSAYRETGTRVVYETQDGPGRDNADPMSMSEARRYDPQGYEPEVYEVRRPRASSQFVRDPPSPGYYPVPYAPSEARPVRSVSHTMVDRPYRENPLYYRDSRDEPRMSGRPRADPERSGSPIIREVRTPIMAPPPRSQPTRIYIDEFGREYIEPPRPSTTVVRHSIAPPPPPPPTAAARHTESVIYEHTPPVRTASGMAIPTEPYGGGGVYAGTEVTYPPPRRVITEPEYPSEEYRHYRQREFSVRQPGPIAEDYGHGRHPIEGRPVVAQEPPSREYIARTASVRPPAEPMRYEIARSYGERLGSVRPEPIREYATAPSLSSESRREVVHHPVAREYSVRPEAPVMQRPYSVRPEAQVVQRSYSLKPVEQGYYYEPPPRDDGAVTFIERPRAGVEGAVYSDMPHRETYR